MADRGVNIKIPARSGTGGRARQSRDEIGLIPRWLAARILNFKNFYILLFSVFCHQFAMIFI
jgi:hypothetical protein